MSRAANASPAGLAKAEVKEIFNIEAENRAYMAAADETYAKLALAMSYADITRQHLDIHDRDGASIACEKFLLFARQIASLAKQIKPKPHREADK